jgi:hypothetical protein
MVVVENDIVETPRRRRQRFNLAGPVGNSIRSSKKFRTFPNPLAEAVDPTYISTHPSQQEA